MMEKEQQAELANWIMGLRALLKVASPGVPLPPLLPATSNSLASPTALPVLDYAQNLDSGSGAAAASLLRSFKRVAAMMRWRQTYGEGEADGGFLRKYGWAELAGVDGLVRATQISAGLLLLGPECHYPAHRHPAHEIYVPLFGTASWFDADRGWREVPPWQPVVHPSGVAHAMRTAQQPLLAYFHWSGPEVGERARFS